MAAKEKELKKVKVNIGGVLVDAEMDDAGNVNIPEEAKEVIASSLSVIEKTKEEIEKAEAGGAPVNADNIMDSFKGLPMRELIGAPLFAAAEAQEKLASIALNFYDRIAFYQDGQEIQEDKKAGDTRILRFPIERPVIENGTVTKVKQVIEAPFLGLVPIPSLLIDRIDVDFQMEVTDTNTSKTDSTAELQTNLSAKWFTIQASVSGKVSTSRENTRTTNQTAKYQVHVSASQQPQTEGLSKLMDILNSCIEPVDVQEGK